MITRYSLYFWLPARSWIPQNLELKILNWYHNSNIRLEKASTKEGTDLDCKNTHKCLKIRLKIDLFKFKQYFGITMTKLSFKNFELYTVTKLWLKQLLI